MRIALCVLLSLALGLAALPARAEEPTPPPAPKPDPSKALYISESLMPSEKNAPEGWELEDDDSGFAAIEDKLIAIGEGLGLDDDSFYVQLQAFSKGGANVIAAMVDVDKKVFAYKHALTAKATESGWSVSDLGHPGRILVISGSGSTVGELEKALHEHAIYALTEMAMNRIRGRGGQEDVGRAAAVKYTRYIESIAPGAGAASAVRGVVHWIQSRKAIKKQGDKPDRGEEEKAVKFFGKAFADGTKYPPKGSVRVWAAAQLGGILLTWKDKSKLDEATRALEIAVKYEKDGRRMSQRFESRYNLACAYARAKRVDDAFKMLEKSLEVLKNMPVRAWRNSHKHAEEKDEDMAPLRNDPRFSKLMEDFRPPAPKKKAH